MRPRHAVTVAVTAALAVGVNAQQRAPSFEVASIKPNRSDTI
ncbi:MAG TPA: hypothetical protein VFP91_01405 [Vicinamibacterales bacterium]|nr:hypothetical protein [Vicinamibacterales bacterium]